MNYMLLADLHYNTCCHLVEFLVFNSAFGRYRHKIISTNCITIFMSFIGRQIDKLTKVNISFYLPMKDRTRMMKGIIIGSCICRRPS